jgi:hypothetical protein
MKISYSEILAWKSLTNSKLLSWELDAILELDSLFVDVYYRNNK